MRTRESNRESRNEDSGLGTSKITCQRKTQRIQRSLARSLNRDIPLITETATAPGTLHLPTLQLRLTLALSNSHPTHRPYLRVPGA